MEIMNKLIELIRAIQASIFGYDNPPEKNNIVPKSSPLIKKDDLYMKIDRVWFSGKSTIGKLFINGEFQCYTLEDPIRNGVKVDGETAIPAGTYEVVINYSPRFKTQLPMLKDVLGFTGIRIHPGNTAKDTEGCILLGETRDVDFIGRRRRAFNEVFKKLQKTKRERKRMYLTINN